MTEYHLNQVLFFHCLNMLAVANYNNLANKKLTTMLN